MHALVLAERCIPRYSLRAALRPLAVALVLALAAGGVVRGEAGGEWRGIAGILAGLAGLALVFAPSRYVLTFFLVFILTGHQFRSFFLVSFGGIEWHPREMVLLLLLAHGAVEIWRKRSSLDLEEPLHLFFYAYCLFFVFALVRGVWLGNPLGGVVAEFRYAVFLASYFVFIACVRSFGDVHYYVRVVFWVSVFIAGAALGYFAYRFAFGAVDSFQNALGEFVRRTAWGRRVQSVRPNGHHFFEVIVTILCALVFCPAVPRKRKVGYIAGIVFFAAAIGIMMMRTAYLSLGVSLTALAWMALPRRLKIGTAYAAGAGIVSTVLLYASGLWEAPLVHVGASIQGRLVENQGALHALAAHPLLGCGLGSTFTGLDFVSPTTQFAVGLTTYQMLHNVWIYFLYKGGLAGAVLVIAGLGGMMVRAYAITEHAQDIVTRYFLRGLWAATIGQFAAALTMPRLTYPGGAVFLAMVAAAYVVYGRMEAEERGSAAHEGACATEGEC